MNKATGVILLVAAVGGGYAIGRATKKEGGEPEHRPIAAAPAPAKRPPVRPPAPGQGPLPTEVYKVFPGTAPMKGGAKAKVTIIEFSEFQCPFCSRVTPTMKTLLETYKDDVQVVFKNFPLPFHNNAQLASEAGLAAHEQGKFWEMHDKLFANQQALDRPNLEKYAQELGLNVGKFKAALDSGKFKATIEADQNYGKQFGISGTPSFFINGRKLVGAQPLDAFKQVVDSEIRNADAKLKAGVSRDRLYAELIKDGLDKAAAAPARPPAAARPGSPQDGVAYKADVTGAPIKGAKDALVTIVQFSDFQCPFCSRVEPTMDKIMDEYKGKVRIAWRDLPLPFHNNAMPAAIAARAAGEQGKFWEMHRKLFTNQQNLDRPSLEKYAQELGLNMGRFKAALDQQKHKEDIEADSKMGAKIGASGTPAFFVNGTFLSGAQPFEQFKARIDEQMKKAEALVKAGTPKAKVYDALMKDAKPDVASGAPAPGPAAVAPAPEPAGPENDQKVVKLDLGKSPSKGPKNAPITVVVFSDFQCPFCSRVVPTLKQLEKEYPGKIRTVWKNFPLEFHQNAKPAAQAAMAAGEQGKFWEMHDMLFEHQQQLDRPSLEKYAGELGLNMAKFKAALDGNTYSAQIDEDQKQGASVGVQGTPASFINGRKIDGAYPYPTFKKMVDQELSKPRKGS